MWLLVLYPILSGNSDKLKGGGPQGGEGHPVRRCILEWIKVKYLKLP